MRGDTVLLWYIRHKDCKSVRLIRVQAIIYHSHVIEQIVRFYFMLFNCERAARNS